jgi:hypothetical protein
MSRHVLLNNISHKDLKVSTRYSAEFGDNVHAVMTFPTEFGDIQREYPIFFRADPQSAVFQSVALLGVAKDENLFLNDHEWQASYVPGIIARGPFLIGFQDQEINGEMRREPVIHIDLQDSRVGTPDGTRVFLEHGGNSPYLERISRILRGIHEGMAVEKAMFAAFREYELIEPVSIQIDLHDDAKYELQGFYTLSQDKIYGLDGVALEKLNRAGFLQLAYMILASHSNVTKLIDMKRKRLATQQNSHTADTNRRDADN